MKLRRASRWEIIRLRAIADYQFGVGAGECLIPDDAIVGVSPNTLRIREVYGSEGVLLATLRAEDYYFTLSLEGAKRLLECFGVDACFCVVVDPSKVPHKSIPSHAVLRVCDELRAGDEVIVVDPEGRLVGVGRLRLSPLEIKAGVVGEAIRLRKRV